MRLMALLAPTLTTARLVLRPFRDADRREVFELHSHARVMRYWDSAPWSDETQADRFLSRCRALSDNEAGARVAVERRDTGRFIGWIGLQHWDHDNRSANLGYVFAEYAWGQGYATEAGRALLEWGFDVMDLNRVHRPTPATRHRRGFSPSLASRSRGSSARTSSWTARCPTTRPTACCAANGRPRTRPLLRSDGAAEKVGVITAGRSPAAQPSKNPATTRAKSSACSI